MEDLELDFARFGSIRLDFKPIIHIFPGIYPRKNEKNEKSVLSGARFGQMIVLIFPIYVQEKKK